MKRTFDTEIEFGNLKPGVYNFDFKLDSAFFASYNNEKMQGGDVVFHVKMEKNEHLLTLFITFSGHIATLCDRCLGAVEVPVQGEEMLDITFRDENEVLQPQEAFEGEEAAMDTVTLPANAYKVDLAQHFYEMAAVAMPMQCLHPDDENGTSTCNPDMLKYLVGEDKEVEGDRGTDEIDPRWAILQQLKEKK
ncbi:MAG: DUF177 domain-containing protein [Bacteroidales bacterium]|nr:DUF177 domain-containing protein [Bacteroidales bacterium]